MSEQTFIDAALTRGIIEPARLHDALAGKTPWTSVAGRLYAAGVDRTALLSVLSEVTGLSPAPHERLQAPHDVEMPIPLRDELRRIGAVPLGRNEGKLLLAVISQAAYEELSQLDLPPYDAVIALEQDAAVAAGLLQNPELGDGSLGDSVSAETLEGGVRGDLATMSVGALAKLLLPHERDAEVLIELEDGTRGKLGFRAGALVYASCGDEGGIPAVARLSAARRGRFRVLYDARIEETNLDGGLFEGLFEPPSLSETSTPAPVDLPAYEGLSVELDGLIDEERDPTLEDKPRMETPQGRPDQGDHAFVASKIAGFHVGALIGRGASGLVHRATRLEGGEEVALKLISPERSSSANFMQRAKRETTVQASLRHRNVVAVHAFGQEGDLWYLASELIEGGPLSRKLREAGRLPSSLVALLVRDILAGVEHAHHNHVIHRDLKPGNVLLTSDGRAKLADFGLARSLYDPFRTTPGIVMGTPQYMSPEQVSGVDVDYRTDFFSIATLAYEMVTATSPFKDANAARSMLAVAKGERPALVDVEPTVLPLLETAIEWLGEREPEARPEKAALVLDRIDPLAYAVERLFPDVGRRFIEKPRDTAAEIFRAEAKLELERAQRLLASGAWHVPQAAFAAWRASALDDELVPARELRDRIALENGYSFEPTDNPALLALEDVLATSPNDVDLLQQLTVGYREERNVPMLVRRLRRLTRLVKDDDDTAAALSQMIGDPMGPFKRR